MMKIRGCMKDEYKKTIFVIAAVLCVVFSANIYNTKQSYRYRKLCDQYREQLITAEKANRELTDRFGRVTEIVGRIKETADANITNARGIIETVERLRMQIKELENICGGFDYNKYYQYWDSYYRNEGLME